jgi:hypothetical protein
MTESKSVALPLGYSPLKIPHANSSSINLLEITPQEDFLKNFFKKIVDNKVIESRLFYKVKWGD